MSGSLSIGLGGIQYDMHPSALNDHEPAWLSLRTLHHHAFLLSSLVLILFPFHEMATIYGLRGTSFTGIVFNPILSEYICRCQQSVLAPRTSILHDQCTTPTYFLPLSKSPMLLYVCSLLHPLLYPSCTGDLTGGTMQHEGKRGLLDTHYWYVKTVLWNIDH